MAELAGTRNLCASGDRGGSRKDPPFHGGNPAYARFRLNRGVHSEILDAWCVDTCQMWYSGLGQTYDRGDADDDVLAHPGRFQLWLAGGAGVLEPSA